MTPRRRAAAASLLPFYAVLAAALVWLPAARTARAASEEFSTFGLFGTEEDDESTIDHLLTSTPPAWRDQWERSRLAVRMSQGCFTSGQWIVDSDLKLSTSIGGAATFGVYDRRYESDDATWTYTDLLLRFPTRFGALGGYFRPYHDKSRQDFGGFWDTGNDSIGLETRVVFTLEDAFNNFWAFRQTRVGDLSEPYLRHPYEAALHVVDREPWVRWEVSGKWLTPSTQQVIAGPTAAEYRMATLWGAQGDGSAELRTFGLTWLGSAHIKQARSVDDVNDPAGAQGDRWRNRWSTAIGVRGATHRTTADLQWVYEVRRDHYHPATPEVGLDGTDRVVWLDSWSRLTPTLNLRLGGMVDWISIATSDPYPFPTYGSRRETRAYFGFGARFGNFAVSALEGIELDREPYPVTWHHDKGFITLQATF
jgi:hypothetical protein